MRCRVLLAFLLPLALQADDDLQDRLKMAHQIAREHNDPRLVELFEQAARSRPTEETVRKVEAAVGIDPGGWSMAGQPLFHPRPGQMEKLRPLGEQMRAAMAEDDVVSVNRTAKEMLELLGDQAGVPDGRKPGVRPPAKMLTGNEVADLFLRGLNAEKPRLRPLLNGEPLPGQMLRKSGELLSALAEIRPLVAAHQPTALSELDHLASGVASSLIRLQRPEGFFPFPDLRGRNIRFGDMIERGLREGRVTVENGWVTSVDPEGGSQFDNAVCGVALLRAGRVFGKPEWTASGLRSAEWCLKQPCVPNFNYNAFSVWLLCEAYSLSKDRRHLEGALQKFRLGVAPGQAPNGRWMDAHNARTVYHVIILRALTSLHGVASDNADVKQVLNPALDALLSEFDAMGITVECLPELAQLRQVLPEHARLKTATASMASLIAHKSGSPHHPRLHLQLPWAVQH